MKTQYSMEISPVGVERYYANISDTKCICVLIDRETECFGISANVHESGLAEPIEGAKFWNAFTEVQAHISNNAAVVYGILIHGK